MRLKRSSKNSARRAPLLLNFLAILFLLSGCTSSTHPTYTQEKIESAVREICKKEYRLDVTVKLAGSTLWVYLPVENIFTKSEKPEKTREIFKIVENKIGFQDNYLKNEYAIKKIPPTEELDDSQINKEVSEKLMDVWKAVRRVVFSMKPQESNEIKFFRIVVADIKNGYEIITTTYYLDLKKVSYGLISSEEFQHRITQDTAMDPAIVGDKAGHHLKCFEITMQDFLAGQIKHRIALKFQRPELKTNDVDIDREILKIIAYTLNIYDFKDFGGVEINNLMTYKKVILNKAAVLSQPNEKRF